MTLPLHTMSGTVIQKQIPLKTLVRQQNSIIFNQNFA